MGGGAREHTPKLRRENTHKPHGARRNRAETATRVRALAEGNALESFAPDADDLEGNLEVEESRVAREPDLGGAAKAAFLLGPDRLAGIPVTIPAPGLDLAENQPASAPKHDVELVPPCSRVRLQDAIAAQPVVAADAPLGARPERPRRRSARHSSGLRRRGGGSRSARARERRPSGRA